MKIPYVLFQSLSKCEGAILSLLPRRRTFAAKNDLGTLFFKIISLEFFALNFRHEVYIIHLHSASINPM